MSEADLVTKIIKEVKARYPRAYVRKIADRFTRGLPDIIIVCPCEIPDYGEESFFLAVECKTDKGRQSHLQRVESEIINNIPGALYIVARGVEDVVDLMAQQNAIP